MVVRGAGTVIAHTDSIGQDTEGGGRDGGAITRGTRTGNEGDALVVFEGRGWPGCEEDEVVVGAKVETGVGGGLEVTVARVENQEPVPGVEIVLLTSWDRLAVV